MAVVVQKEEEIIIRLNDSAYVLLHAEMTTIRLALKDTSETRLQYTLLDSRDHIKQ